VNTPQDFYQTFPPRPPSPAPPPAPPWHGRLWVHVALFGLTLLSSLLSQLPVHPNEGVLDVLQVPFREPGRLWVGLPFAATLMAILLAHEMGHYLTARRYGVDQSLPYFLPAPTLFGTLGAVILMRSQPRDRRVLLHVAVMGPYVGLLLAIPAAAWGLAHSIPVDIDAMPGGLSFGDSLLFGWLEDLFSPNGTDVILHPVGLAGWVGLFITSLNLIPAAQLDGGHVAYALFGRHQLKLSLGVVVALLTCGLFINLVGLPPGTAQGRGGEMWILWAVLLFAIGLRHPPVQDEAIRLTPLQRLNGAFALVVFVVTFIPVPVRILDGPDDEEGPPVLELPQAPAPGGGAPPPPGGAGEEFKL
jgi:membrane-associated protease RseP (regulator of RpoE activity)